MAAAAEEYWRIGRLLRPWGRGEWLVAADGDGSLFAAGRELFVKGAAGEYRPARVETAVRRGARLMVRLAPEALCAREAGLFVPRALAELGGSEATPWLHDLIGATLHDGTRGPVGTILELVEGPAHPWLRIGTAKGPQLVPYVEGYAPRFDRAARTLTLELPPGLLAPESLED